MPKDLFLAYCCSNWRGVRQGHRLRSCILPEDFERQIIQTPVNILQISTYVQILTHTWVGCQRLIWWQMWIWLTTNTGTVFVAVPAHFESFEETLASNTRIFISNAELQSNPIPIISKICKYCIAPFSRWFSLNKQSFGNTPVHFSKS